MGPRCPSTPPAQHMRTRLDTCCRNIDVEQETGRSVCPLHLCMSVVALRSAHFSAIAASTCWYQLAKRTAQHLPHLDGPKVVQLLSAEQ